ncbi:MAG: dihydropteroate synthase [Bacteroidota bacterium]
MYTINCGGKLLVTDKPIVMGIINTTPDSFFKKSRKPAASEAVAQATAMLEAGAAIIDIGGQSTRPGASMIGAEEEGDRVVPAIQAIAAQFPGAIISIDTYHATVAKAAVKAGASVVNDISGGLFDSDMLSVVGEMGVPYICMHNKGNAATMHKTPHYDNLLREVLDFFIERIHVCKEAGIKDVIVDPGFGFAKTIAHNFELLREISLLKMLDKPILLGISRKSTIYKTLGITAEEALNGTSVLHTIGLLNGANILRVHDVKEAIEVVKLVEAYHGK